MKVEVWCSEQYPVYGLTEYDGGPIYGNEVIEIPRALWERYQAYLDQRSAMQKELRALYEAQQP